MELKYIVAKMKQLNVLHRFMAQSAANKVGLHFGQLPILECVNTHEKCTQKDLSDILQVSPPSIATSVKRMQKSGLIEKTVDETDLRYTNITITQKGKELAKKCREEFDLIDQKMFQGFTAEERENFYHYLERMIENLSTPDLKDKSFLAILEKIQELDEKPILNKEDIDD